MNEWTLQSNIVYMSSIVVQKFMLFQWLFSLLLTDKNLRSRFLQVKRLYLQKSRYFSLRGGRRDILPSETKMLIYFLNEWKKVNLLRYGLKVELLLMPYETKILLCSPGEKYNCTPTLLDRKQYHSSHLNCHSCRWRLGYKLFRSPAEKEKTKPRF